jgi:S1-C subfamily serine protease
MRDVPKGTTQPAHVIKGAQRVQVVLTKPDRSVDGPPLPGAEQYVLPATVVGFSSHFDLALLRVEATGLPTLPLADFWKVSQGQVVIAIQPVGLDNSVTMGSPPTSVRRSRLAGGLRADRRPDQPGNSGGPVDLDGRLTPFILSQAAATV